MERVVRVGRIRGELEGVRWKRQVVLTGGGGSEVPHEEDKWGVFVCFIYLIKGWAGSGMGLGGLDWIGLDLMGLVLV